MVVTFQRKVFQFRADPFVCVSVHVRVSVLLEMGQPLRTDGSVGGVRGERKTCLSGFVDCPPSSSSSPSPPSSLGELFPLINSFLAQCEVCDHVPLVWRICASGL